MGIGKGFVNRRQNQLTYIFPMLLQNVPVVARQYMHLYATLDDSLPAEISVEGSLVLIHDQGDASRVMCDGVLVQEAPGIEPWTRNAEFPSASRRFQVVRAAVCGGSCYRRFFDAPEGLRAEFAKSKRKHGPLFASDTRARYASCASAMAAPYRPGPPILTTSPSRMRSFAISIAAMPPTQWPPNKYGPFG